jgi:hypothetical protein
LVLNNEISPLRYEMTVSIIRRGEREGAWQSHYQYVTASSGALPFLMSMMVTVILNEVKDLFEVVY